MMIQIKSVVFLLLLLPRLYVSASWESSESTHFRVYYRGDTVYPESILQIAEEFYTELPRITRHIPDETIKIYVCDTQKAFQVSVHAPIKD